MAPEVRKILLIRPSALGDVCRTVPVLVRLRRQHPDAHIDWLVQEGFEPAIASHPNLSRVVTFPRRRLGNWWQPKVGQAAVRWMNEELRGPKYDLVVDCQGLLRSGIFMWWTRAPKRVGHADAAELGWLGANQRVKAPVGAHTVDRMISLVGGGPATDEEMQLYTSKADRITAENLTGDEPYVVIAPTSRWPGKRWPAERFAIAIQRILDEGITTRIVLVGGPSERDQCSLLLELAEQDERVIDLVGKTSVGELMAVIERSSLVLANDSAALHMAVGFGRPLVALFGPTRIDKVGPYHREHDVIQNVQRSEPVDHKNTAAGRALMERISVDEVVNAMRKCTTVGAPR